MNRTARMAEMIIIAVRSLEPLSDLPEPNSMGMGPRKITPPNSLFLR
jgi:hypothetical protein